MALTMIKNVNLALVFFLELAVLVALGYWGFSVGQGVLAKFGIGLGLPVVAIIVWGLLGAPKSPMAIARDLVCDPASDLLWFCCCCALCCGSTYIGGGIRSRLCGLLCIGTCAGVMIWRSCCRVISRAKEKTEDVAKMH